MGNVTLPPRVVGWAVGVYALALAVALLAPTSSTQAHLTSELVRLGRALGMPQQFANFQRAEFLCNVLILMPLSALGSLRWPRLSWRDWTTLGFVIATSVEVVQGLLLPDRQASYSDIVANTLGGLAGALVVAALRAAVRARAGRSRRSGLSRPRTVAGTPPTTPPR